LLYNLKQHILKSQNWRINMSVLLTIHSVVRWLIVIVAVVAAVKFAMGWLQVSAA
jgi:hypothetical protein